MDIWTPVIGEALVVKREPTNSHDVHAVAVYNNNIIVGHVPYNIAPTLSAFLRRDVNKAFSEVTGIKVNRGAGYGLEIPCIYRLYGPKAYVDKMHDTLLWVWQLMIVGVAIFIVGHVGLVAPLGGDFVQLLLIGGIVAGRCSEFGGGRFSEVRNVLVVW